MARAHSIIVTMHCLLSQNNRLVGDVLLCTGFLSYCGPFNQVFRMKMNDNWQTELGKKRIPYTDNLNLTNMLTDAATVR